MKGYSPKCSGKVLSEVRQKFRKISSFGGCADHSFGLMLPKGREKEGGDVGLNRRCSRLGHSQCLLYDGWR